jgi:hypothetical protein
MTLQMGYYVYLSMDSTAIKNTITGPHDSATAHGMMDYKIAVLTVQQKSVPSWRQELEVSLNGVTTFLVVMICQE